MYQINVPKPSNYSTILYQTQRCRYYYCLNIPKGISPRFGIRAITCDSISCKLAN
jgi:hypothetical protein